MEDRLSERVSRPTPMVRMPVGTDVCARSVRDRLIRWLGCLSTAIVAGIITGCSTGNTSPIHADTSDERVRAEFAKEFPVGTEAATVVRRLKELGIRVGDERPQREWIGAYLTSPWWVLHIGYYEVKVVRFHIDKSDHLRYFDAPASMDGPAGSIDDPPVWTSEDVSPID